VVSLQQQLTSAGDDEKADIVDNLEFYKANTEGLSEELKQLRGREVLLISFDN